MDENKHGMVFKKGQHLFHENGYATGIYCINQGKLKLFQTGGEGKEQIVRFAKEGDVLGYRALMSGDTLSVSAVALEEVHVCFLPREAFFSVISSENTVSFEIIKRLSDDLRALQEKVTLLAQKSVRERAAETLLFLKETFGFEGDNQIINVALSREEIAGLIGTATETAIRLLSDFKHEGLIELAGKKIKILDVKGLVRLANMYD
ncbi:MAG: Crp/Fnr family transcriptional regulator [Bacteroidia bacterium]